MRTVDIVGIQLEVTTNTPVVVLREHDDPHRLLPLVVGGSEATAIAFGLADEPPPRPQTHDLLVSIIDELGARVAAVEVVALTEGTFVAELVLDGPEGARRLDARPSDAIALALRTGAPVSVSDAVLEAAGTPEDELAEAPTDEPALDEPALDENEIEAALEAFREELAELSPADFLEVDDDTSEPAGPADERLGTGDVEDTIVDALEVPDDEAPEHGQDDERDDRHGEERPEPPR